MVNIVTLLLITPFERRNNSDDKKKYKPYKKDKGYKRSDKLYKKKSEDERSNSRESHLQASLSSQSLIKESTLAL
jgi:hypothetical protein